MRVFTAVLLILLVLLQYRLWFGKNSVPDYIALKENLVRQLGANEKLQQRNKLLYADTDDLKLGLEAIEERARNELGMIKENETFFRLIPKERGRRNVSDNINGKVMPYWNKNNNLLLLSRLPVLVKECKPIAQNNIYLLIMKAYLATL